MSTIHNVINLTAGKITSRDLGYKHICFKTKDRYIITDRDFTAKSQIPEVQLTPKKRCLLTWKTCQKAEGKMSSGLMWAGGQMITKAVVSLPSSAGQGKYNERLLVRDKSRERSHTSSCH